MNHLQPASRGPASALLRGMGSLQPRGRGNGIHYREDFSLIELFRGYCVAKKETKRLFKLKDGPGALNHFKRHSCGSPEENQEQVHM